MRLDDLVDKSVTGRDVVALHVTCPGCISDKVFSYTVAAADDDAAPQYGDDPVRTTVSVDSNSPRLWGVSICLPPLVVDEQAASRRTLVLGNVDVESLEPADKLPLPLEADGSRRPLGHRSRRLSFQACSCRLWSAATDRPNQRPSSNTAQVAANSERDGSNCDSGSNRPAFHGSMVCRSL